jgi:hypothetical protein
VQLFDRGANTIFWTAVFVGVGVFISAVFLAYMMPRRDAAWNVGETAPQPVPFSHDHHVGGLGIDCRYCHTSVTRAAFAGMPSAGTCMSCHSQVWTAAAVLEPIRRSIETGEPIGWRVLHNLPAFSYFHHGVHVSAGVACETCHGRIDLMPQTMKVETLSMGWCLDCHRNPEPHLRPPEAVFAMGWTGQGGEPASERSSAPPEEWPREWPRELIEAHGVRQLTDCSTCHR